MTTRSSSTEEDTIQASAGALATHKMSSTVMQNGDRSPTKGFKESLSFFQSQVDSSAVTNNPAFQRRKHGVISHIDSGHKPKLTSSRPVQSVPSVDNILNNVKTLRAAQNGSNEQKVKIYDLRDEPVQAVVFPIVHKPSKQNEVNLRLTSDTRRTQTDSSLVTISSYEQNKPSESKSCSKQYFVPSESELNLNKIIQPSSQPNKSVNNVLKSSSSTSPLSTKANANSGLQNSMHSVYESSSSNRSSITDSNESPRTVTDSSIKKVCSLGFKSTGKQGLWPEEHNSLDGDQSPPSISTPIDSKSLIDGKTKSLHTENQSKLKDSSNSKESNQNCSLTDSQSNSISNGKQKKPENEHNHSETFHNNDLIVNRTKEIKPVVVPSQEFITPDAVSEIVDFEDEDSEKRYNSFESDYDSKDFVVHKANISEDYLETMSEDAYSSMNDDYEVEHPADDPKHPNIPSPDYVSDEEDEYEVHRGGSSQDSEDDDEENDFVDNSAHYANDPRRYVYYQENNQELEVIPEEDEDDLEEEEFLGNEYYSQDINSPLDSDQDRDEPCSGSNDDSSHRLTSPHHLQQAECDSGVTDDQRSTSTTADDCCDLEVEDDTDSAKGGSLLQQDSSSESPTQHERRISPTVVEEEDLNDHDHYDLKPTLKILPKNNITFDVGSRKIAVVTPDFSNRRSKERFNERVKERFSERVKNLWNTSDAGEEKLQPRSSTSSWDPTELLKELYRMDFRNETKSRRKYGYINKEGYLEKLPSGRKKATYWNPWKKRYFRLQDGFLHCYDNQHSEKSSMTLQLMGGDIDTLENNMLGIDDRKGHYMVVRCCTLEEAEKWEKALLTHCCEDFTSAYIQPVQYPLSSYKDVIIIDLGSCSTRAGILMGSATLPQLFFPTVCAEDKIGYKKIFGIEALKPELRKSSLLSFPVLPSAKVTKYTMDVTALPDLFRKIFTELNVDPLKYKVQVSIPRSMSLQTQIKVAKILLEDFGVQAINLTHQAILSLYAYNATSGIVVDIGDRMDILPINEGYIVEGGVTRLPYGGQRIVHHLKHALAQKHVSLVSDVESYLARHVLEQLCYVAEDYKEEVQRFHSDPDSLEMSISTSHLFQEQCPWEEIILDSGRFQVPEGLFTPELWGLDNPGIHKLVHRAIQECSLDVRKEMTRSIYVSGGVTLLPGFVERLEVELDRLTPAKVTPKVHASPHRYHMSYLGACQLASSDGFEEVCVTKAEWRKLGNTCLQKWHI